MRLRKFVCHSKKVLEIAARFGWEAGARYTNLRDVKHLDKVGFLDINWKDYDFCKHLIAAKKISPSITIARDVENVNELPEILEQAFELNSFCENVAIVPKDPKMADELCNLIPNEFLLAYSVPTKYGGTTIPLKAFGSREVHLLGGRPDRQRNLANSLNVVSLDTNRFTLDASFGDYFDGEKFRPHPIGGYETCLKDSLMNINSIWDSYKR